MRDAPREPRELPSQMRSKAPHTIFFFQLKHAGKSTQLANLARRCRRQTSPEAISIQKGPPTGGAGYKLYREFRTQRRPLNVAFVLRRTVEQETLYPAPPSGDRAVPATASCSDRRRRRTARFHLGRIYGGRPPRSWLRYRYRQTRAAPLRESPDAQAS